MVCFTVHIALPQPGRESNTLALERRIEHLVRHCNAQITQEQEIDKQRYYEIRVCNEDGVSLLRDFPSPFTVLKVDYLHTDGNLYTYRKHCPPPRTTLLKQVYWLAKSTERWRLPILDVLPQTK